MSQIVSVYYASTSGRPSRLIISMRCVSTLSFDLNKAHSAAPSYVRQLRRFAKKTGCTLETFETRFRALARCRNANEYDSEVWSIFVSLASHAGAAHCIDDKLREAPMEQWSWQQHRAPRAAFPTAKPP
jgi:hypothetical protein